MATRVAPGNSGGVAECVECRVGSGRGLDLILFLENSSAQVNQCIPRLVFEVPPSRGSGNKCYELLVIVNTVRGGAAAGGGEELKLVRPLIRSNKSEKRSRRFAII